MTVIIKNPLLRWLSHSFGVANLISVGRMFFAFAVLACVFPPLASQPDAFTYAFWGTVLVIWADGWDGYAARALGESSPAGAVIDILSDRVVELAYWVSFAVLGWVPVWVPLVVLTRGIWVDGLRALALQEGFTAFGSSSLMQSWWGVLLVSSRFSRWTYAVAKAVVFALLIWQHAPSDVWFGLCATPTQLAWLAPLNTALVGITVSFCLLRGIPVLIEGRRFFSRPIRACDEGHSPSQ
ncbi:MAG: CDP-alcohol phosphatidyltransferase family protein [Vampirovibrionales bacterium]